MSANPVKPLSEVLRDMSAERLGQLVRKGVALAARDQQSKGLDAVTGPLQVRKEEIEATMASDLRRYHAEKLDAEYAELLEQMEGQ
ncbi:MAG: hypothetical protein AB7F74_05070 [Parvibaculaceae bacterium]